VDYRRDLGVDSGVSVHTMIDNVCIAADDPEAFCRAVRRFLLRSAEAGATLNDCGGLTAYSDDNAILAASTSPRFNFLGEEYLPDGTVRNTTRNVDKVRDAYETLQQQLATGTRPSRRQVASLVSLAVWMGHTLNRHPRDNFDLLRLWSRVSPGENALAQKWDEPLSLTPAMVNTIGMAVQPLLVNKSQPPEPARDEIVNKYDAAIIVDASATGMGFFVARPNAPPIEVRRGWGQLIRFSAWAEPIAAREAVAWVRKHFPDAHTLAVVTDHSALATGQRRPVSGNGGFSKAFHANEFYRCLYADHGVHDIFFVEGSNNPADVPSRTSPVDDTAWRTRTRPDIHLPALETLHHPYREETSPRPIWCV
jgi:hypothetical protein